MALLLAILLVPCASFLPAAPRLRSGLAPRSRRSVALLAAADDVIASLFSGGEVDADAVAAACASDVVWDDRCRRKAAVGREAVRKLVARKWRRGQLKVERVAEAGPGSNTAGFSWRREGGGDGGGLRGITIVECDESGAVSHVVEGAEPLLKPGKFIADLFAKAVAGLPKITGTYEPREPTGAGDLVRYIWKEAYPAGAPPSVFTALCADGVVYEDTNYKTPIEGKAAVEKLGEEYDLGGVEWVLTRSTTGDRACAFTWQVKLKGEVAADGVSFLEGLPVTYVRDIPSPLIKPPPLQSLAALLRPALRTFRSRKTFY